MTTADRLEQINRLAVERDQMWEKLFSEAGSHEQLQAATQTCNAIEGAEKSARFLAKNLRGSPFGVTLQWLLDELQRLRAPYAHEVRTPGLILTAVAREFGITVSAMCSDVRTAELVIPRHTAMYLLRVLLKLPLVVIGDELGRRDHSTVIYGLEAVLKRMRTSPAFKEIVERLESQLRSTLSGETT
jgi:chromosomal replication initiator protein